MEKIVIKLFAESHTMQREIKLPTGGGSCQFRSPITGEVHGNDTKGKHVTMPVGSKAHLISINDSPDIAVVLLEIPDALGSLTWSGAVLRKVSWQKLLSAASVDESAAELERQISNSLVN